MTVAVDEMSEVERAGLLACPACRSRLSRSGSSLVCVRCDAEYLIESGIPHLLGELDEVKRAQASWFDDEVDEEYEIERPSGTPRFHAWLLAYKFRCSVSALRPYLDGAVVAVVCAGSGMDAEFLARAGARVLAFDISPGGARRTAERARRHGLNVVSVVADAEHLPLADLSVDIAYVHDGLHHLERPAAALGELARVARRAVSVNEPARAIATRLSITLGYSSDVEEAGNRVERLSLDEVAGVLRSAGLDIAASGRYAMVYRHVAGRPVRALSSPALFPLAIIGFRLANLALGAIGNKLTVQALRREGAPSRIAVHEFGGFPFPVQLSRELARRGATVLHLHCPSYPNGRGRLERRNDDPIRFRTEPLALGRPFRKYAPVGRALDEMTYARQLRRRLRKFAPDIVVSDAPLLVQRAALAAAREQKARFIFWQQDIHSLAMREIAHSRLPFGAALGRLFARFEQRLLLHSDAVVPVAESFLSVLDHWQVPRERVAVIENWAPIEELPVVPRSNEWRRLHRFGDEVLFLYAGTLGLKHDWTLLDSLGATLAEHGAALVVVSEGLGASALSEHLGGQPNPGVCLLPFQPYESLAAMLGAGDVLVALLGHEFGDYSVPSKVLTYHCAGRPLLASMPLKNPASQFIQRAGSGIVVEPDRRDEFLAAAVRLVEDADLRREFGRHARAYAEQAFGIAGVTDRFERMLDRVAFAPVVPSPRAAARADS